jgi:RND family efflux transporter MFP subunit
MLASINTKFNGWVEKLNVNATGQAVKKGEPLLDIYSPELVAVQEEYLIAFRARQAGTPGSEALLESARRRMQFMDVTAEQIALLEKEGTARRTLTIASPFDGIAVEKSAVEGKAITAGENLFRVADLSTVWILADVYESELSSVKAGLEATATFTALPGEKFSARVGYVYPYLDERTRTAKARLEAPNPGGKLKPDMWGNVEIVTDAREALSVPASAVIQTGERSVAFVDKGNGHLEPRELKLGLKTDEYIEVLEGLSEGEKVVTRALFLVDSESQLRAAISGMGAAGEHQH